MCTHCTLQCTQTWHAHTSLPTPTPWRSGLGGVMRMKGRVQSHVCLLALEGKRYLSDGAIR